jgi:hypothetical protein
MPSSVIRRLWSAFSKENPVPAVRQTQPPSGDKRDPQGRKKAFEAPLHWQRSPSIPNLQNNHLRLFPRAQGLAELRRVGISRTLEGETDTLFAEADDGY